MLRLCEVAVEPQIAAFGVLINSCVWLWGTVRWGAPGHVHVSPAKELLHTGDTKSFGNGTSRIILCGAPSKYHTRHSRESSP